MKNRNRYTRNLVAVIMAFFMTNLPHVAFAESHMIATSEAVREFDRAQTQARVQSYLQMNAVKKALAARGISPDEMNQRLASLSDQELRQMADQMDQARYGGDILIAILIVVLIIFLIKRL
jgi:hypothetical protein